MKRLSLLLITFLFCFTLFAEETDQKILVPVSTHKEEVVSEPVEEKGWWDAEVEEAEIAYDLYFRTVMVRGSNFTLGGGLTLGLQTASFKFELYGLMDYFLKPLGGDGGASSMEFMVEPGMSIAWKMLQVWKTRTFLGIDVGYYMQMASLPRDPKHLYLGMNGLMLRPKITTQFKFAKHYDMSLGFFYQIPLYPGYSEYKGFGVIVGIL